MKKSTISILVGIGGLLFGAAMAFYMTRTDKEKPEKKMKNPDTAVITMPFAMGKPIKIDWAKAKLEYEVLARREKPYSRIVSKHQFDNNGYYEDSIVCRIAYGSKDNSCDTIFIGKQVYYVLMCGTWRSSINTKTNVESEGYALSMEVDPKNGRRSMPYENRGRYYWLVYLDEMCGFRLSRLTRVDRVSNTYISYLK